MAHGTLALSAAMGSGQLALAGCQLALAGGQLAMGAGCQPAIGAGQIAIGGGQAAKTNAQRIRRRRRLALEGSTAQNTQPNPSLDNSTGGGFDFTTTPFIKLDQSEPSWQGPVFEDLGSIIHGQQKT